MSVRSRCMRWSLFMRCVYPPALRLCWMPSDYCTEGTHTLGNGGDEAWAGVGHFVGFRDLGG
jgi:hypothetical protein